MHPTPSNRQSALIAQGADSLGLAADFPIPEIREDQILVRIKAAALNPSDWKLLSAATYTPGAVAGSDFSGTVMKVGTAVGKGSSGHKIGDSVFGCVFGSNPSCPSNGAFAEYVAASADLCFKMPETSRVEEAASFGLGLMTVGLILRSLALVSNQHINQESSGKGHVLVYGASTATGTLAIQILKSRGLRPIAVCSPRNFELVRLRGAVASFDYSSPACIEDIRKLSRNQLEYAIDCITSSKSTTVCYGCIGDSGGRYCALESFPGRLWRRRKNVIPEWILGWTIFGEAVNLAGAYQREAQPADRTFAANWVRYCNELLERGELKSHPIQIREGLFSIIDDIRLLRTQQISGRKIVYRIS